jgi:hypothetical protein
MCCLLGFYPNSGEIVKLQLEHTVCGDMLHISVAALGVLTEFF